VSAVNPKLLVSCAQNVSASFLFRRVFFSERVPDRTLRQERALIFFSFFFFQSAGTLSGGREVATNKNGVATSSSSAQIALAWVGRCFFF